MTKPYSDRRVVAASTDSTTVADQRCSSPGGDLVGRDKITTVHVAAQRSQIEGWLDQLAEERRTNMEFRNFVDNLQYYLQPTPYDGISGLEAKLDHAGRSAQKKTALRKKEAFSRLLENWKAYPAAQEIIAYFLAKIEAAFETDLLPYLEAASPSQVDTIISMKLVDPVLKEMGCGPFMLNSMNVSGMVYWLAEQCYVRWHA